MLLLIQKYIKIRFAYRLPTQSMHQVFDFYVECNKIYKKSKIFSFCNKQKNGNFIISTDRVWRRLKVKLATVSIRKFGFIPLLLLFFHSQRLHLQSHIIFCSWLPVSVVELIVILSMVLVSWLQIAFEPFALFHHSIFFIICVSLWYFIVKDPYADWNCMW